ncbi:MAG TPA: aminotransferase class V-fold PLP-dependent enzyme [Planctomicrobium sp.]|nr:aminotransferase class V-fold PLP-dependent enzyme [Planctomicrobium sp.]
MSIFEKWGVHPIINVSGPVTRLGGAPMPESVLEAFCQAARESAPLDQLQGAASLAIAEATRAEAGLVTCGASGALMLGAAAILAGDDIGRMERLPLSESFPNEFVVAREQRNPYDHAVRAAGVRFVEVGFHEPVAGSGVRRAESWEYEVEFGPRTAGVFYVLGHNSQPSLNEVVAVAHSQGLPVLVDAAGEVPPHSNLRSILTTGADLVAFSGGKGIRGPQSTGILCGRRDLIASAALQMLDMDDHQELWEPPEHLIDPSRFKRIPRQGIGRALKVSKEQIVALLTALELFLSGAYDQELVAMCHHLERVAASLNGLPAQCRLLAPKEGGVLPSLEITLDEVQLGRSALEICRSLRRGIPSIQVGHGLLHEGKLTVNPMHLNEAHTEILIRRFREELTRTCI